MLKKSVVGLLFIILLASSLQITAAVNSSMIELASFSSSLHDQTPEVKQNITIAAEKINGHIIRRDKIFSFNDVVGEGSAENGFVDGLVLYQDKTILEAGGGICQVSSTLYNAMLLAGFTIKERHRHYQPVSYVPLGLDATIKYGKKDLKMKNNLAKDIVILTSVSGSSLNIKLMAQINNKYKYEVFTEEDEMEIPFTEDRENYRPAITVFVYRKRMLGDKVIDTGLLYKDFYPPVKYE